MAQKQQLEESLGIPSLTSMEEESITSSSTAALEGPHKRRRRGSSTASAPKTITPTVVPARQDPIERMYEFLTHGPRRHQELDEDKVFQWTLETHRMASQRIRHRQDLSVGRHWRAKDRHEFYRQLYPQEEGFAMAKTVFKAMTTEACPDMDKKTLEWLEHAAGLQALGEALEVSPVKQSRYAPSVQQNSPSLTASDSEEEAIPGRRVTRGAKKELRQKRKRKEQTSWVALMEAVKDLEE